MTDATSQYAIAGETVTMPVQIRRATQHMAMFSVDADAAQRMIDYSGLQVCRYRPRGLPKAKETWDVWWRDLGPSPELFDAFYGKGRAPITLDEYRERYTHEMQAQQDKIATPDLGQTHTGGLDGVGGDVAVQVGGQPP